MNSREDDFSPTFESDNFNSLIFTSNREGATGKENDEGTGSSFTDLFLTRIDKKGEWSTPNLIETEEKINTATNEGSPMMNSSFTTLYFARCGNEKAKKLGCHIYKSKKTGRTFSDPEIIDLGGDSTSRIFHPTLSDDEMTIFFTADFPDGQGGTDIYYATREMQATSLEGRKIWDPSSIHRTMKASRSCDLIRCFIFPPADILEWEDWMFLKQLKPVKSGEFQ